MKSKSYHIFCLLKKAAPVPASMIMKGRKGRRKLRFPETLSNPLNILRWLNCIICKCFKSPMNHSCATCVLRNVCWRLLMEYLPRKGLPLVWCIALAAPSFLLNCTKPQPTRLLSGLRRSFTSVTSPNSEKCCFNFSSVVYKKSFWTKGNLQGNQSA